MRLSKMITTTSCSLAIAAMMTVPVMADSGGKSRKSRPGPCVDVPSHKVLKRALRAVAPGDNAGIGLNMWGAAVNRDGIVCAVVFTGDDRDDQWPGSRVIALQKANTANAFSLEGLSLSTANLFSAVQPGGSLFGLQFSNPVATDVAYKGPSIQFGQRYDPAKGKAIGGVNVFGGGLALYARDGKLVGGIGVSGDTSCTDHIVAWRTRDILGLDNVPGGVADGGLTDNIIFDISDDGNGHNRSASGFGHPLCGVGDTSEKTIAEDLPNSAPIGGGAQRINK